MLSKCQKSVPRPRVKRKKPAAFDKYGCAEISKYETFQLERFYSTTQRKKTKTLERPVLESVKALQSIKKVLFQKEHENGPQELQRLQAEAFIQAQGFTCPCERDPMEALFVPKLDSRKTIVGMVFMGDKDRNFKFTCPGVHSYEGPILADPYQCIRMSNASDKYVATSNWGDSDDKDFEIVQKMNFLAEILDKDIVEKNGILVNRSANVEEKKTTKELSIQQLSEKGYYDAYEEVEGDINMGICEEDNFADISYLFATTEDLPNQTNQSDDSHPTGGYRKTYETKRDRPQTYLQKIRNQSSTYTAEQISKRIAGAVGRKKQQFKVEMGITSILPPKHYPDFDMKSYRRNFEFLKQAIDEEGGIKVSSVYLEVINPLVNLKKTKDLYCSSRYLLDAKNGTIRNTEMFGKVRVMEKRPDGLVRVNLLDRNQYAILNPSDKGSFKRGFMKHYKKKETHLKENCLATIFYEQGKIKSVSTGNTISQEFEAWEKNRLAILRRYRALRKVWNKKKVREERGAIILRCLNANKDILHGVQKPYTTKDIQVMLGDLQEDQEADE